MDALHPAHFFHIGITAVDIDAAMAEMTRNLGIRWVGAKPIDMELCIYGEMRQVRMRIAHSVQFAPQYELIQCVPDTPWAAPSAGVHHVCYWSEDPASACAALETGGSRRILGRPGAPSGYFQSEAGMIVEIIGTDMRDHIVKAARRAA